MSSKYVTPEGRSNVKKHVYGIITKRRSIRRFRQDPISFETLEKLVDAARVAPSASNIQPLEYIIVDDKELLPAVFATLKWARHIAPAGDPPEGEGPTAYIVILANKEVSDSGYERDVGASAENIALAALEEGIGSCLLGSIDRDKLRKILDVPSSLAIDLVIALGYSAECPVVEEMADSMEYWKDESGILHVPKRRLGSILHRNKF